MSFEAILYRAVMHQTPLWGSPNTSDGRYNVAGDGPPTQYLCFHPHTTWAEQLRNLRITTAEGCRAMRYPVWAIRAFVDEDPVEIDFDNVADWGLEPHDLVSDDRAACRVLARRLFEEGVGAFIAPSAALPGTRNLVVLREAVVSEYHLSPVDPIVDWPTALVEQGGRCPEGLWDQVHHRGAGARSHAGLAAWESGDVYGYEQPLVTGTSLAMV